MDGTALPCSTTYTLYITATVSPHCSRTIQLLQKSPRAILERFTGSNKAINAPDWASWTKKYLEFQQPKRNFAALFARMATWDVNKNQVCLDASKLIYSLLAIINHHDYRDAAWSLVSDDSLGHFN